MDQEVVDRVPLEIQKQIVYNFLLLREDIQPCVGTLVGYRMLINSYPETLTPADCQQFMRSIDHAIEHLEWCYLTYIRKLQQ